MEDQRLLSSTYRTAVYGDIPCAAHGFAAPKKSPPNVKSAAVQPEPCCPVCLGGDAKFVRRYHIGPERPIKPFSELTVQQCMRCQVAFAHPSPNDRELDAYYAERYGTESGRHSVDSAVGSWEGGAVRARAQMEFLMRHVRSARTWLDIGAGQGFLVDEARSRGVLTGAIEPDIQCGQKIRRKGHEFYARLSDVRGAWDVISVSHVLEHVTAPRRFLHDIRALLSKDGHVFCEVPNETCIADVVDDVPHLLFFTPCSLERLFQESGMAVTAMAVCGAWKEKSRWHAVMTKAVKGFSRQLLAKPPRWVDRFVHHHFRYTTDPKAGAWIRLLARPR